ncbi:hypothetical protein B005_1795 [Nocardiopsis alba ATCC BAA-2165]|uniref:Uncharacterized protein n=1 Tax=Nocardiopsis alba (strain ATCC BAA-2165 / BE74) TaxID=1205910 RepID=J7L7G8_NOCAA|nr:hypothetical protein B005_1795 [Nocardiopsis alba ATCC BAA-2165]
MEGEHHRPGRSGPGEEPSLFRYCHPRRSRRRSSARVRVFEGGGRAPGDPPVFEARLDTRVGRDAPALYSEAEV